jgi:DNA invertase Pin-like site-specific DNA recombinase
MSQARVIESRAYEVSKMNERRPELEKANPKFGGRPRRALDWAEVQRLQAEGLSLRQIARRLHAGYGTVHRLTRGPQGDPELIQNPATGALD